jgi:hypothetical protein
LETADWRLPIGDCRLEIADWRLPIGDCRLETADWRLPIGGCRLDSPIAIQTDSRPRGRCRRHSANRSIANVNRPLPNPIINRQSNRQSSIANPIVNRQSNHQSPIQSSIANRQSNRQSPMSIGSRQSAIRESAICSLQSPIGPTRLQSSRGRRLRAVRRA